MEETDGLRAARAMRRTVLGDAYVDAQTADPNGFVSWNSWKLQDIGLSAGSWKIQAIASLNGQTKTASDALDLVVAQ